MMVKTEERRIGEIFEVEHEGKRVTLRVEKEIRKCDGCFYLDKKGGGFVCVGATVNGVCSGNKRQGNNGIIYRDVTYESGLKRVGVVHYEIPITKAPWNKYTTDSKLIKREYIKIFK